MGIGNVLSGALNNANQGQGGGAQPSTGAGVMPDVMTPAEAAQFLKVSAEDVVAAIEAGDLKARKLGTAYRISKDSLNDFLNG